MMLSRANSAPVITFSVPTVQVTPVPVRGSLLRTSTATDTTSQVGHSSSSNVSAYQADGQLPSQPLALPRPPRCLTPYPDTSNFPPSLEPSPLSSPAFSAYSMASSHGNQSINTNTEDEGNTDVEDLDLNVDVKAKQEPMSPKEIMSPGARARAVCSHMIIPPN